jgi:drug/metabolite transporter (DMT)-like permease
MPSAAQAGPDTTAGPLAPSSPPALAIWAGIWVLYLVWGSTYLGIAIAVETIPPFLMAAVRFLIAGGILLAWSAAREGRGFDLPSRRQVRDSAIVGTLLLGGGMGMVAVGEQTVPSGVAALFVAMMPLWVAVFGRTLLGDRLPAIVAGGIGLGLVGVAVLVWPGDASLDGVDPLHLGAVILSPISWALGSVFAARRADLPRRPLVATAFQMILGGLALAIMSVLAGEPGAFDPAAISGASMAAFVYLTLIGSLFAFTVFAWLIQVAPLARVTTYAYVNPVVAVILGAIVLGEPITPRTVVAGGIIVVAVALIVTARGRLPVRRRPAAPTEARPDAEAPLDPPGTPAAGRVPAEP